MLNRQTKPLGLLVLALILASACAQAQLPTGAQQLAPERYRDVPEDHWALDAIRRLSVLGVLTGYPDQTFQGERAATRYELAVVAARLVDLIGGSLADLALDPAFWEDVDRAAELLQRFSRLEAMVEGAASEQQLRELERRVRDMEEFLNGLIGEQRFPLESPEGAANNVQDSGLQTRDETSPVPAARTEIGAGRDLPRAGQGANSGEGEVDLRRELDGWLGIAAGYPVTTTLHVGLRDLWSGFHIRAGVAFGAAGFGAEVLGLFSLPVAPDASVLPYLGAGPMLLSDTAGTAPGVLALAGMEIPLGRTLDTPGLIYLELGPQVDFGMGTEVGVMGRVGLGYRF